VFALLWRLRLKAKPVGWVFGVYLVLAGVERFLIEFLRAKDDRLFGPLTVAQVASLLLVVAGAVFLTRLRQGEDLPPGPYLSRPATA
jgi:phosphatidylglycerol:prolipoprotein diacylglycerol transferase